MTARRILRRTKRGKKINRKLPYHLRAHRAKRFDNRRQKKLFPSIRANKKLELWVVKELLKIFPISHQRYEIIKARTENGKDKGFSPAMVGQKVMLEWLEQLRPTTTQEGWQTSILRQQFGSAKDKTDKSAQKPETHAHDGIALAASYFMSFEQFHTVLIRGHHWVGQVTVNPAPFWVISCPNLYKRQLHFNNPEKAGDRKRKGGTITPFRFCCGDKVRAEKTGIIYIGCIGGYTQTKKEKKLSVYNHNWRQIEQLTPKKFNCCSAVQDSALQHRLLAASTFLWQSTIPSGQTMLRSVEGGDSRDIID